MNKGKTVSIPTSVEAQVRTRARNLPVYKCYVNSNWKKEMSAIVIVVRKHTNGNVTIGDFFVDLNLYGVNDCTYQFNESPLRVDELLKRYHNMMEECDYSLAHNIIYAGLEFAKEYGFDAHKNFKTAQFILNEDTEDIPLMEIPLGDGGIPVLEISHGENGRGDMAILDKTAGGNYKVVYLDEKGEPIAEEKEYSEIFEEVLKTGIEDYIDERGSKAGKRESQVLVDLLYLSKVNTEEDNKKVDEVMRLISEDKRLEVTGYPEEKSYDEELKYSVDLFNEDKTDEAVAEMRRIIDAYPGDPLLWDVFLHNTSIVTDTIDEKIIHEAYLLYPKHPFIKAWYAEWLAQEGRYDEIFVLFDNKQGLDALTEENVFVDYNTLVPFCYAYAMAWLHRGDISGADPYYSIIVRLGADFRIGRKIQDTMTELKRKKLADAVNI